MLAATGYAFSGVLTGVVTLDDLRIARLPWQMLEDLFGINNYFPLLSAAGLASAATYGFASFAIAQRTETRKLAKLLALLWLTPILGVLTINFYPSNALQPGLGGMMGATIPGGPLLGPSLLGIATFVIPVAASNAIICLQLTKTLPQRHPVLAWIASVATALGVLMFSGIQLVLYLDWTVGLGLYLGHGNEWAVENTRSIGITLYTLGACTMATCLLLQPMIFRRACLTTARPSSKAGRRR